jgi:hypothetical protein
MDMVFMRMPFMIVENGFWFNPEPTATALCLTIPFMIVDSSP